MDYDEYGNKIGEIAKTVIGIDLIEEFRSMSKDQKEITLAILISSSSGGLSCKVSTKSIVDMFKGSTIKKLGSKVKIHERVVMIKDAFEASGRSADFDKMFEERSIKTKEAEGREYFTKVWIMNGRGFSNLLVNMPGVSVETIMMRSNVLAATEYSAKFIDEAIRNGYKQSILDLIEASDTKTHIPVKDILALDDKWTVDEEDRKIEIDDICAKCFRVGHTEDDCDGIR